MNAKPRLNSEGEEAWLRFKSHLELCEHFALAFVFSEDTVATNIFRERLADMYRARVTRLKTPEFEKPSDLADKLLPELLTPPVHRQALQAPIWLDLSRREGSEWSSARLSFLVRLNEQRETLRRALDRPLVLILPASERARIKELVPDLWAIRDFSMVAQSWTDFATVEPIAPAHGSPPSHREDDVAPVPLTEYENSLIEEWKRLEEKDTLDRGFLLAGERAFEACLRTGRYSLAFRIARSMRQTAEKRLISQGETPQALRDLSVSLERVGDAAGASGRLEKAGECFEESLGFRCQILRKFGETPETLRDLAVSLERTGSAAKELGDWEKARKNFEEGLDISSSLSETFPDTPDYIELADHFRNRLKELDADRAKS